MTNNNHATLTDEASRRMIAKWITGDIEADARALRRAFRGLRFSLAQWRQAIAETVASL